HLDSAWRFGKSDDFAREIERGVADRVEQCAMEYGTKHAHRIFVEERSCGSHVEASKPRAVGASHLAAGCDCALSPHVFRQPQCCERVHGVGGKEERKTELSGRGRALEDPYAPAGLP